VQLDKALALYDPAKHGPLVTRFGYDVGVATLSYRALALWVLGYPDASLRDAQQAFNDARVRAPMIGNMLIALVPGSWPQIYCGSYDAAKAQTDTTMVLADQNASWWKSAGMMNRGWILAVTGEPLKAIQLFTSGITSWRSTNQTLWSPLFLSYLAKAHADVGQFYDARRSVGEAITELETTGESWCEAEIHRIAGEITLLGPNGAAAKAENYFERSLFIVRQGLRFLRQALPTSWPSGPTFCHHAWCASLLILPVTGGSSMNELKS
jgi:hypothetical protein